MKISILLPTLNEAENIDDVLSQAALDDDNLEIIVSDGGSIDGTQAYALRYGATLLEGASGRGQQLACASKRATGDILLFLHADTRLPANAMTQIRESLADDAVIGGNFHLTFDGDSKFAQWLNGFYAWLRSKDLYYGDSAIFVRRHAFEEIGGIRPISLMEDYDLVQRMEHAGDTVCLDQPGAITSSRRFEGRRPWRIFWQWCYLHVLFHLGASPGWLARLYRSESHAG